MCAWWNLLWSNRRRGRPTSVGPTGSQGRLVAVGPLAGRMPLAEVDDDAADQAGEDILGAVIGAHGRQRVSATGEAVARESVGDRAGDGDLARTDLLAVDEELAGPRRAFARLEVRRTSGGELPAQGNLAFGYRGVADHLV